MTGDWRAWETTLTTAAPLHLGWHVLGMVERTRSYIPARTVWGTLVGGLAPRLFPRLTASDVYKQAVAITDKEFRVTGLFPDKERAELEREWLFSQSSAALEPERLTAEEGALHESEFLKPGLKLKGYVLLRGERLTGALIAAVLGEARFGAERGYGWGMVKNVCLRELARTEPLWDGYHLREGTEAALVWKGDGAMKLRGHLLYSPGTAGLEGELEVVAGRGYDVKGGRPGNHPAEARLCWAPGSVCHAPAETAFHIDTEGFWSA